MPTTTEKGYLISVRQTGGSAGESHISFINARSGNRVYKLTVADNATTNLNNTKEWPNGYNDGDVIDITGTGIKTGNAIHTVNRARGGGRIVLTMTDASTTNAPAVTI